jgi:hypothetical protein
VEIYLAIGEVFKKKERRGQNMMKLSLVEKMVHFLVSPHVEG